jgi:hypothetical protein
LARRKTLGAGSRRRKIVGEARIIVVVGRSFAALGGIVDARPVALASAGRRQQDKIGGGDHKIILKLEANRKQAEYSIKLKLLPNSHYAETSIFH